MKKQLFILISAMLSIQTMAQTVPSYVATASLNSWYPFTGNSNDSSGHGNNGVVTGAFLSTDRFGNAISAYSFNGMTNYITTPAAFTAGGSAKSYSAWFKLDTVKRGWIIAGGTDASAEAFGLFVQDIAGEIAFQGMGASDRVIDTVTDTSIWHNIVVTYSIDTLRAYIDGNLKGTFSDALVTASSNIIFGRRQNPSLESGYDAYFQGKIDEIGIWDRRLSECEAARLFLGSVTLITRQPANDTLLSGGTATYAITDTGGTAIYQWQVDTGAGFTNIVAAAPYSGVATKTLTVNPVTTSMTGNLYRCVRDAGACVDTSLSAVLTIDTAIDTETSVNNIHTENSIIISPNPTQNIATISSSALINKVEVSNLLGQTLLLYSTYSKTLKIDLSALTNGLYVIKINGATIRKIVKD